jgi:iron complex transport system ATP-binding protein
LLPKLLLLDEPTSSLDLAWQLRLLETTRSWVRTHNLCAVAVLHDLKMATHFADRLLLLQNGRLLAPPLAPTDLSAPLVCQLYGLSGEQLAVIGA